MTACNTEAVEKKRKHLKKIEIENSRKEHFHNSGVQDEAPAPMYFRHKVYVSLGIKVFVLVGFSCVFDSS